MTKKASRYFSGLSLLSLVINLVLPLFLYPIPALAQEVTPFPTPVPTTAVEPTPEPTLEPTATPVSEPSATPTDSLLPTLIPTVFLTPTVEITNAPTSEPVQEPSPSVAPTTTTAPSPTDVPVTETPVPTIEISPTTAPVAGSLDTVVIPDKSANSIDSLNLTPEQVLANPTLATDKADYAPTDAAIITGTGFLPATTYTILITADIFSFADTFTTDANGGFVYTYQLDGTYRPFYNVQIKDASGTVVAATSFTDSNPSANLDQCANDPAPSPSTDGCSASATDWVNGNLGASKAVYLEGDSIPYRMTFDSLSLASHTVTFEWDTTKSDKHATDYLTTYNRTVATANPCLGVSGCGSSTTFPIPVDPQVSGGGVTPVAGNFTLFGGTITAASAYSYANGAGFTGDKSARITITFTASVANPVLAWGGHISTRADWGPNSSATAIPGSPYHMRLIDLDGSGGNQDRSLSADAIIYPGSITIIKSATPEGSTSFPFTATPSPLANFNLVDDGTSANTHVFGNIIDFKTFSVSESAPAGWSLTGINCSVASPNGGSQTISSPDVDIDLKEGENVTCTYNNVQQNGTLIVKKHVINDNGGSATAANFTLHVKSGVNDVTGSPAAGSESGTSYTLPQGSYVVSENTPVSGYSMTGFSDDCDSNGNVSVVAGQTKTCTITNDDIPPQLHLRKVVINNNGGSATTADFTLTANGTGSNDLIGTSPVDSGAGLLADTFALSETSVSGYSASDWVCVGGTQVGSNITVGINQNVTCTITNDDIAPQLTVIKHVINDDGGTADASDFTMNVTATNPSDGSFPGVESPGTTITLDAGSYSVDESAFAGYAKTIGANCSGTIAVGQSKTCTIVNDDIAPTLKLVKVVVNNNGGVATPGNWNLTATGTGGFTDAGNSTTFHTIKANEGYVLSESSLAGYAQSGNWSCDGGSLVGSTVTLGLDADVTCTVNNDDQAAHLIVIKHVINDNGGSATAGNFTMDINGVTATGGNSFPGVESPGTNKTLTTVGAYNVTESGPAGYSASFSTDCTGTIALGETKTCTITNNDIPPQLHLRKVVVNDNGGSATTADFTLTANGTGSNDLTGTSPVDSGAGLLADTFALSETSVSGYSASDWVCVGGTQVGSNITVGINQNVTCTITNDDQQSYIIVDKTVSNTHGGTALANDFFLTVDGNAVLDAVAYPVNPGVHTAGETLLAGYTAGAWGGDCNTSAQVTVALGQTKTCTITNTDQAGSITIIKNSLPDGPQNFSFTGGLGSFSLDDDADGTLPNSQTFSNLSTGIYSVTEGSTANWTLTNLVCVDPTTNSTVDLGTRNASINLALGESVTCTFTNSRRPQLIVVKHVINDNGGTALAGNFTMNVTGTNVSNSSFAGQESPGTEVILDPGSYSVDENAFAGYAKSLGADCSGTVVYGDVKTCTITNDDIAPQLIVIKHVINDNGGTANASDFTLDSGGTNDTPDDFPGAESPGTTITLNAGAYNVTESGPAGYAASFSADCSGSVTIGQTKTCTVTNNDIAPILHLRKVVVNNNGGSATTADFTLTANGTGSNDLSGTSPVDSGAGLLADTFALSETTVPGYSSSAWSCVGGNQNSSNITVGIGQEATCTITNDDIAPTLTIVKDASPNDCQDFNFSLTGQSPFILDDDANVAECTDTDRNQLQQFTVNANINLTAAETLPNEFWELGSVACVLSGTATPFTSTPVTNGVTVNIPLATNVTCTFVNNKLGATRTLGFWQTHTSFTSQVFADNFGSGMPIGVAGHKGYIFNYLTPDHNSQLFGGFYASISKLSNGKTKRSAVDQAKMQLLQQLIAAKLNCAEFGCGSNIQTLITAADTAFASGTKSSILNYASLLDDYNNSGDTIIISGFPGKATPTTSKLYADLDFWDTL